MSFKLQASFGIVNFKFQNCDFGKAKRVLINRCAYVQRIAACLGKTNQRTENRTETCGQSASLVTFRQIRYFIAVAESGKISAAASMLGISPSVVTEAVSELETLSRMPSGSRADLI
jgi:Bacterial regulatory helix-turn-helix protein, lysR family